MNATQCECEIGQYCRRHEMDKPDHWMNLCRTSKAYFEAWENGRGPGQLQGSERKRGKPRRKRGGPGTELKSILAEKGWSASKGCGCNDKAAQMDRWGVAGCVEHLDEIVSWLEDAAAEKGWEIPGLQIAARYYIRRLVCEAIRRAMWRQIEAAEKLQMQ